MIDETDLFGEAHETIWIPDAKILQEVRQRPAAVLQQLVLRRRLAQVRRQRQPPLGSQFRCLAKEPITNAVRRMRAQSGPAGHGRLGLVQPSPCFAECFFGPSQRQSQYFVEDDRSLRAVLDQWPATAFPGNIAQQRGSELKTLTEAG